MAPATSRSSSSPTARRRSASRRTVIAVIGVVRSCEIARSSDVFSASLSRSASMCACCSMKCSRSAESVSISLRRCSAFCASVRAATTRRFTVTEEMRNAASANQFAGSAMMKVYSGAKKKKL